MGVESISKCLVVFNSLKQNTMWSTIVTERSGNDRTDLWLSQSLKKMYTPTPIALYGAPGTTWKTINGDSHVVNKLDERLFVPENPANVCLEKEKNKFWCWQSVFEYYLDVNV